MDDESISARLAQITGAYAWWVDQGGQGLSVGAFTEEIRELLERGGLLAPRP